VYGEWCEYCGGNVFTGPSDLGMSKEHVTDNVVVDSGHEGKTGSGARIHQQLRDQSIDRWPFARAESCERQFPNCA